MLDRGHHYYSIDFSNVGGLVMPIILAFNFTDGTSEEVRIPAEIWAKNSEKVSKVFFFEKEVKEIVLDPNVETADTERNNNYWPSRKVPSRFDLFKGRQWGMGENPMQRMQRSEQLEGGN
jgi:hypothetical protein